MSPFYSPFKQDLLITNDPGQIYAGISAGDLESMKKIHNILITNYQQEFPSIHTLAKWALMSESKFKKLFKRVFGAGPFEYYQKNRMQKAKELLMEGHYSISQIGNMLGYQNLSNFSCSFKKEFSVLPSNILRLARA